MHERRSELEAERQQQQLITALSDSRAYPHPATPVKRLETHISHVTLAGDFAYKIKKPVNLGFVDFRDLNARRHYCEEEVRLNRRTAPALYMEVVPITGSADCPVLGGSGPAIEYAVKMRRFPQSALFSTMIDREVLTTHHVDALAARIASFHDDASSATAASPFGEPHTIDEPALQNFEQLYPLLKSKPGEDILVALRTYTERAHVQMREVFGHRKRQRFVRECHGDLHLENIVWYDSDAMPFDCIEFKESLR
jgi:aminoglycoside phosphotransferase family enzyme